MVDQSPFDVLEASFHRLCTGPSPLQVDGQELGPPFPARAIPLTELAKMLLHPAVGYQARHRAMRLLIGRSATQGGPWTVGLAGVLLPGLRNAARRLVRLHPAGAADLEADVLAALVEAVGSFDPAPEPVASRLMWRVLSSARRRLMADLAVVGRHVSDAFGAEPHRPWGHPDFVLGLAVRQKIITVEEADLIGETRLGLTSARAYAIASGEPEASLRKRRERAERRLARWLETGDFQDLCHTPALAAAFCECGSPPDGRPGRAARHQVRSVRADERR